MSKEQALQPVADVMCTAGMQPSKAAAKRCGSHLVHGEQEAEKPSRSLLIGTVVAEPRASRLIDEESSLKTK